MTACASAQAVHCRLGGGLMFAMSCLVAAITAAGSSHSQNAPDVASLSLTCNPIERGVRCRLLALFQDVSRPSRDVTADAVWHLSGVSGAHISPTGAVDAPIDGDVMIASEFGGRKARAHVRLVRNESGQLLAAVRGRVYVETTAGLQTIAGARVEVFDGHRATVATMTREDGTYELTGLVPGSVTIRVARIGYASAERSSVVVVGENWLSVVIDRLPPIRLTTL